MLGRIRELVRAVRLARLKRKGLSVGADVRFMDVPDFGSEPYLISIGDHVTVSGHVTFITHDGGTYVFRDWARYKQTRKIGRITIGNNCFIGHSAILMPGVEVGDGSVVGAGAVVTKSVPTGVVVAGVPAKVVMTTEEYAERCYARESDFDQAAYDRDARAYLSARY